MRGACHRWPPEPTFLAAPRPHVALASYPRSGSSLTRSVVEALTGTFTGSDFCRNDSVKGGGIAGWSRGETMRDGRVWVVKTHSRSQLSNGAFAPFTAARAVLVVRHPLRVAVSFWSFVLSNEQQDVSVPARTFAQFPRVWDAFIDAVATAWGAHTRFWLHAGARGLPLLTLRYEDLASRGDAYANAVERLHAFLYAPDAAPAAEAAERSLALARLGCLRSRPLRGFYVPRPKNASAEADFEFSTEQRMRLLRQLRPELCAIGYTDGVTCSDADRSATRLAAPAGEPTPTLARPSSGLVLNEGGCEARTDRRGGSQKGKAKAKPPKARGKRPTAQSGAPRAGPGSMRCGAPDRMLQHPFQALACVRQAAAGRGIDISEWDRPPPPLSK